MKKFVLVLMLFALATPVLAEEVNLTPKNSFSGFNNNGIRSKYPQLKKTVSASDIIEERNDNSIMAPKSVREMGVSSPMSNGRTPRAARRIRASMIRVETIVLTL